MKENYILGLDIGISSVGWALLALDEKDTPYKIIDVGSRIFPPGETEKTGDSRAKERREKRGARRIIRRRSFRLDRVRNLLYQYGYLSGTVTSDIVSIKNEELIVIYNNMINNYYKNNVTNPYRLKVEALDRKLTKEELCIILVHYAKKRGYKSNRAEDSNSNESGKVLNAIRENEKIIKENNYRTISEMYIKDDKFKDKIKNSPNNYKVSVSNEMYLEEISMVLDKQITFGLIDEKFKIEYLNIYNGRRHYSKGPGGDSKYAGNLIEKMVGKCSYDGEARAPKMAYSSELFVLLTKLVNLRYKSIENNDYQGLTRNEIEKIIEIAKNKRELKYNDIVKLLGVKGIKFKNLELSYEKKKKVKSEFVNKLNITKDHKININNLSYEDRLIYDEIYTKELFNNVLTKLDGYHKLKEQIEKSFGSGVWNEVKEDIKLLDELALLCTNYKLPEDIKSNMLNSNNIPNKFIEDDFVNNLPNFKDHLMLSTNIIRKLIPLMLEGNRYDQAMEILGYNFSNVNINQEKKDLLVPIYVNENITNQRVIRSLTQARKVINAIIKKYGTPKIINIETARELAKTKDERNRIEKNQLEKKEINDKIKQQLVELGLFNSIDKITSNDLLKYKLWIEQNEFCAYSLKKIRIEDLFANNIIQIDHILPYSRTYNDNYLNKTLVYTKYNQEKGNRTPYEWFGNASIWKEYETFINNLNISQSKKDNYLLKKLDFDIEREMRSQNLNDTKYISKELGTLIKTYLNVEQINLYQGAITAKLRARWGLNRLTHSYISSNYIMPNDMKSNITKDRDNHLHHAMDALVIASITKSLQQKVTLYEKFNRYIDGVCEKELKKLDFDQIDAHQGINYDVKTGEVDIVGFKEYLKEEIANNHIYYSKHNVARLDFPLPYENFVKEAKVRVYERDEEVLKWELKSLNTYTDKELDNVKVLTPSIATAKITGPMHKETLYGIKQIDDIKYITLRKSLENINRKELENIPDKNGGSKDIYKAILNWFGDCEKGADALKKNNGKYPINPNDKEGKEIKKIKIYEQYKNTGHIVNGANVEKGGVYRIMVLKSNNFDDDKLYFVALDIFDIKKIEAINKGKNFDYNVQLWFGQGKNNLIISYKELLEKYSIVNILNKGELVKITTKDGRSSTAYVVGCSSGMFEVKSKLGDGYDLIGQNNIFNKKLDRFSITVSTIHSIEKLSISILGEISGI